MGDQIELFRNSNGGSQNHSHPHGNEKGQLSRQTTINHEITLGTDQDPYNKEELVNTLKGRELGFFVIFYICAVMFIVMCFEFFKPVLFNPNYPDNP